MKDHITAGHSDVVLGVSRPPSCLSHDLKAASEESPRNVEKDQRRCVRAAVAP